MWHGGMSGVGEIIGEEWSSARVLAVEEAYGGAGEGETASFVAGAGANVDDVI